MYLDVLSYFLINLPQSSLRISPGQGQNNQLFGGSLVSVKSIEKVTSTQEQVQEYCNWRKEALYRLLKRGVISPLNKQLESMKTLNVGLRILVVVYGNHFSL